ncbi:MAG: winged-helix domain-containing protein [Nitrososphaeraceae archaeon]
MEIIIRSYDIYYFDILIIDEIDKVILSSLSKNARIPAADIANNLKSMGYKITERAIRYRLRRLEQNNILLNTILCLIHCTDRSM